MGHAKRKLHPHWSGSAGIIIDYCRVKAKKTGLMWFQDNFHWVSAQQLGFSTTSLLFYSILLLLFVLQWNQWIFPHSRVE